MCAQFPFGLNTTTSLRGNSKHHLKTHLTMAFYQPPKNVIPYRINAETSFCILLK